MIFESEAFYIDVVENKDLNDIVEVYNSNRNFLISHLGTDEVTHEWMLKELVSMRAAGFLSCKAVEKHSGKLIGIIDFKIDEETYLSLLMIHHDYKNKGFGKSIYKALEEYAGSEKSKRMRIDVVTGYDDAVLDFWVGNGFVKFRDIELNWTGKILPAVMMKKSLQSYSPAAHIVDRRYELMKALSLVKPTVDLEKEYLEMMEDWNKNDKSHIPWFLKLDGADFPSMVEKLEELDKGIGVVDGFVENATYWLVNGDRKIIGGINIRHRLNDFFFKYGGQVGYGIRPGERRKGYAGEILRLGLEICRCEGLEKVLLCCNENNIGSVKAILGNNGVLDSEDIFNGEKIQRYWITL